LNLRSILRDSLNLLSILRDSLNLRCAPVQDLRMTCCKYICHPEVSRGYARTVFVVILRCLAVTREQSRRMIFPLSILNSLEGSKHTSFPHSFPELSTSIQIDYKEDSRHTIRLIHKYADEDSHAIAQDTTAFSGCGKDCAWCFASGSRSNH